MADSASDQMLPDFIIIGAKKCGTTSLYDYLTLHPEIAMSYKKELRFFSANWHRGLEWYERQFPSTGLIRGEATPDYARHPYIPNVPQRIKSMLPDVKLIYMVRDPIERVVSHHMERLAIFIERRPLEVLLRDPKMRLEYLCESRYYTQLMQYRAVFPASQILIVSLEDMKVDRRATLQRVFAFLGVDAEFWSESFQGVSNSSEVKRRLSPLGEILYPRWLHRLLRQPFVPHPIRSGYRDLMRAISIEAEKPVLDDALVASLAADLADDIRRFADETGYDVSKWKHGRLLVAGSPVA
jgi:hypothetical protein